MEDLKEYKGMKVGDLITAYNKGIWRIDSFVRRFFTRDHLNNYYKRTYDSVTDTYKLGNGRIVKVGDEYAPLINHSLVCTGTGKVSVSKKIKTSQCDADYCAPAIEHLKLIEAEYFALKSIIENK